MFNRIDFAGKRRAEGRALLKTVNKSAALLEPIASQKGIDLRERLSEASARQSEERRLLAERLQEVGGASLHLSWKMA
jgi:hypothetical protein